MTAKFGASFKGIMLLLIAVALRVKAETASILDAA